MKKEEVFRQLIIEAPDTKEKLFASAVYLFSIKGYDRVGIRELCQSLNIKESSFYNHYSSKERLLQEIFKRFIEIGEKVILTDIEIEKATAENDVEKFFQWILDKFSAYTRNPLFYTMLQIVKMESFTNPDAARIEQHNLYYVRREYTEKGLRILQEKGAIRDCNITQVVAGYYYGLMGYLNEFVLLEIWNKDTSEIYERIGNHIRFFAEYLKNN